MSKRKQDGNGYWIIRDNPISKAGVFPYLGAQIPDAPDPLAVYMVYRPAEELGSEACVDSFKLLPWINEHAMLGPEEEGRTPPEEKGVEGVTGEDVYFRDGVLYANLKVFSESLKDDIESGKVQLSPGYTNAFEAERGIFEGQEYHYIQRNLRGNHIALVDKGRSGPDCAVQDELGGLRPPAPPASGTGKSPSRPHSAMKHQPLEDHVEEQEVTLEQLAAALKTVIERLDKLEAKNGAAADNAAGTEGTEGEAKDDAAGADGEQKGEVKDNAGTDGEEQAEAKDDAGATQPGASMDAAGLGPARTGGATGGAAPQATMDAAVRGTLAALAGRDALVKRLTPHVGTFDHGLMTAQDVAEYGCKKLGIQCGKGQEQAALAGYLQGAAKAGPKPTFSLDAAGDAGKPSVRLQSYLDGR